MPTFATTVPLQVLELLTKEKSESDKCEIIYIYGYYLIVSLIVCDNHKKTFSEEWCGKMTLSVSKLFIAYDMKKRIIKNHNHNIVIAARNRGFIPGFISILLLKGKIMEGSRMGGLHIIWSIFLSHL